MSFLLAIYRNQVFWTVILIIYALGITRLTEYSYIWMRNRGVKKNVAVYYDRKIVHMLAITAPGGYFLAGVVGIPLWGLTAAVVASYIERYEFGPIDDNILITVNSSLVLYLGHLIGPIG